MVGMERDYPESARVKFVPFFQRFPQRNAGIHSFCTKAPRFLLEARSCEEQSAHIQRDVLCTLPEHCGRAGGSWQFSRVSCREGSSRKRFGAKLVARALRPPHRVLHTRQDWPPAAEVLQIDRRSLLRGLCLPSGIVLRALFGAQVRDELPHASCVEMGDRTFRENNAVQVAGLDRICLLVVGRQSMALSIQPSSRFLLIFVFSSPRL